MAWLVWNDVIVDGFRGGRRLVFPPFSASTRPAVLALPPAAAVCASAMQEVALDVRVLPKAPP